MHVGLEDRSGGVNKGFSNQKELNLEKDTREDKKVTGELSFRLQLTGVHQGLPRLDKNSFSLRNNCQCVSFSQILRALCRCL